MKTVNLSAVVVATMLTACGTSSESFSVPGATATVDTSSAELSGPVGGLSAGVSTFAVTIDPMEQRAQGFIGPWTLVRSGDRVCEVDLGSRNSAGRYAAKTRRCTSVELARIATWQPLADGVVLYDFEERPVVTLVRGPGGAFEGPLSDGTRLTLWR